MLLPTTTHPYRRCADNTRVYITPTRRDPFSFCIFRRRADVILSFITLSYEADIIFKSRRGGDCKKTKPNGFSRNYVNYLYMLMNHDYRFRVGR